MTGKTQADQTVPVPCKPSHILLFTGLCHFEATYTMAPVRLLSTGQIVCRFVLENSGVAEPQNIRDKFSEAIAMGNPLMSRIQLDTMATIVDSGSFTADYSSRTPVSGICACYFHPILLSGILHASKLHGFSPDVWWYAGCNEARPAQLKGCYEPNTMSFCVILVTISIFSPDQPISGSQPTSGVQVTTQITAVTLAKALAQLSWHKYSTFACSKMLNS